MIPQPRFLAVPMSVRITAKSSAPWTERKQPGDLLLEFRHPSVSFSLVVGERHVRVGQKPQDIGFALAET